MSARDVGFDRGFLDRDPVDVAHDLLGVVLVHDVAGTRLAGRIVETEAYREDDPASHSFRGPKGRAAVMFGPAGRAYVYLIYGVHECFNVVCDAEGSGAAVLVRALEPVSGLTLMWERRYGSVFAPGDRKRIRGLTSGPGKICQAMGITRTSHDGLDLCSGGELRLAWGIGGLAHGERVVNGRRIGITKAADRPWRFWIEGNEFVSR